MKTSIMQISMQEISCVNGGIGAGGESFIKQVKSFVHDRTPTSNTAKYASLGIGSTLLGMAIWGVTAAITFNAKVNASMHAGKLFML